MTIQIIRWHFFVILYNPFFSPMLHLVELFNCPPFQCDVIFSFSLKQLSTQKYGSKCHVAFWLIPTLPHVSFDVTVVTPFPLPQKKCHLLFEWPQLQCEGGYRLYPDKGTHAVPTFFGTCVFNFIRNFPNENATHFDIKDAYLKI